MTEASTPTADYLKGSPHLADHLESGLEALGIDAGGALPASLNLLLRGLLPEINAGHVNLAEAIIMLAGEPLPASQIVTELDMDDAVPVEARALALSMSLAEDERFRNAGAIEAPLWALAGQS